MNLRVDDGVIFAGDVEDRLEDLVGPQWELQTVHAVHVCRDQPMYNTVGLSKQSIHIHSTFSPLYFYSLSIPYQVTRSSSIIGNQLLLPLQDEEANTAPAVTPAVQVAEEIWWTQSIKLPSHGRWAIFS
jgi:hypothetical protein